MGGIEIGVFDFYEQLKHEGKTISKKHAELIFAMYIDIQKEIESGNRLFVPIAGGFMDETRKRIYDALSEVLTDHPDIIDRNIDNFREYYGFDRWDKKIVETINDNLNSENPSSGSSILVKATTGAGVKVGNEWIDKKPGGDRIDGFAIKNNRINLISREMWWQDGFNKDSAQASSPPGDHNCSLWFDRPLSKPVIDGASTPSASPDNILPNSIETRYDTTVGFSKLKYDGQTTADGLWTRLFLGDIPENTRKSRDYWTREFSIEFFKLLEYDETQGRYNYTSTAADRLLKDKIDGFLKQLVYIKDIEGGENINSNIMGAAALTIMNAFREQWWISQAEKISQFPETATNEEIQAALEAEREQDFEDADQAADNAVRDIESPAEEEQEADRLSDEERKRRNLLLKQCALMVNLPELSKRHREEVARGDKLIHKISGKHAAYKNRFYMVQDGNDEGDTVNKILIPPFNKVKEFVDMKPEVHAHLVPKIRLFRVDKDKTGKLIQKEFIFPKQMNAARTNNLKKVGYDRGAEFGIKEFSFSFNGTNPATARNDIEAKLSLYFQSFKDFIERRNDMAFVDLIIHPSPDKGETINAAHPDFYSAKNYRIKVDVGWELSSIQELNYPAPRVKLLREALQKTNKSFYLNRIDETLDFRDDGSVQIDIEYRAYAETATKGTALDALSTHESRKARNEVRDDYLKVVNSAKCSPEQLARIQSQLEQMEALVKRQSYQSIYKRLLCNDSMHFARMDRDTAQRSFRLGRFDRAVELQFPNFDNEDLSQISRDYEEISYFYLGDLLYAILDSIYQEQPNVSEYIDGTEKFKFILSSFKYEDPFKRGQARIINIGSIPISNEIFKEWFTDNVLKSERNSYPIMFFIRDLCKYLITEILTENCFKKSLDKKFEFKTMTFTGLGNSSGGCRMTEMYPSPQTSNNVVAKLSTYYDKGVLPLVTDDGGGNNIDDLYHYILIFANGPKIILENSAYKTGNKTEDGARGLYHYQIGRDRGILKKMKFSKTDIAFLREARYLNNGFDGLMQLANVYKVSLDMIGNTLYYPGMEIYIDPVGFMGGSTQDFNPSLPGSVANKLGFGGYHIVEKVNSTISPGKFTTTIEALFVYAGDGNPQSRYVGANEKISKITESSNTRNASTNCTNIVDHVELNALEIADGRTNRYSRISDDLINQAAQNAATPSTGGGEGD